MNDYNYVAEACSEILRNKDIGFNINGYATTEEEWKTAYEEQIGKTEDNIAIMSTDPSKWQVTWAQIKVEVEKLKVELPLREVRIERNHRLTNTDWVAARASETGIAVSDEWKTYRQALRDITKTATSMDDVVWPTKPS
jgi:L-lactate utilization protein LutC|tara:strand:+ start:317 stop:733 length:417 start_codon:yes stop_codon:yes gene_type:complete